MAEDIFEKRRKQKGLASASSSNSSGLDSAFEARRMEKGLIADTRTKASAPKTSFTTSEFLTSIGVDTSKIGKTTVKPVQTKTTMPVSQPETAFQTPLMTKMFAGTGDKKALTDYEKNTGFKYDPRMAADPRTQYQIEQENIDKSNWPTPVKAIATVGNKITRGNPVGQFISKATTVPGVSVEKTDSTGNRIADKTGELLGNYVSPLLVPTGAPLGSGTMAAPYEAASKLLNTGVGQKTVNALGNGLSKVPFISANAGQNLARVGLTEGLAGTIQNPAQALVNDSSRTNKELLTDAAIGGAAGLGLGMAGETVGRGISAGISKLSGKSKISTPSTVTAPKQVVSSAVPEQIVTPQARRQKALEDLQALQVAESAPTIETTISSNSYSTEPADIPDFLKPTSRRNMTPEVVTTQAIEPIAPVTAERGFLSTMKNSDNVPMEVTNLVNGKYNPITNEATLLQANKRVQDDMGRATSFVLDNEVTTAESITTAQRLIQEYSKTKNYEMAATVAEKAAADLTRAGQSIQAASMLNKLSPEGTLIRAQRIAQKTNEKLPKWSKEVKLTPEMSENIVDLAQVTEKMTNVKDLSANVMGILERAKAGEKLDSIETDTLKRFVEESKQFIQETTKKSKPRTVRQPKEMSDSRVRDKMVSFLDAQEEAAKARLKARGNRVSSTPLDVWADYAVIGAAKMGKQIVKFSDWSEAMVKDLGEEIRPMLGDLYNRSDDFFKMSSKKIYNDTVSQAEKLTNKIIKTKELSQNEAESLIAMAQKVSGLSGEAKRLASQDLQVILQQLDKPSTLKKISTGQTMAQLLNPKTHVRNVLGNELFYRTERLNKLVSTPIDIARSKLTGGDRYVTFKNNNQGQFWKNWLEGTKAGWRGVNINGLETQFDLAGQAFKGKLNPMTYLEKTLGAALRGFDNAAYMRAFNESLGEIGTLDAMNKGIKPTKEYVQSFIAKADDNIIQMADEYGKYITFQDNNAISMGLTKVKRGMNFGKEFGVGDLILKYPKTPGALLMRAMEFSPAGFLRSASIMAKPLLKKGVEKNPREATIALSRAITGTAGLTGMGYFLMDKGIITGAASKDRDIRSLQSSAGQGAYQVNISALKRWAESSFDSKSTSIKEGDILYTYDWMQPISVSLSLGANIKGNLDDKDKKDKLDGIGSTVLTSLAGGVNSLTEQSVLQGLASLANGVPGQSVTDKLVDIVADYPASFIPTFSNQIKQLTDNVKRETYSTSKLEQSMNKAQVKIPGLASKFPKKYDTLGNEQKHYQDNSIFNVMFNPGFVSKYELSPEAKIIVDLITETGDETLAPRVPGKTVQGNKLNGEQFSRLSQLQGEATKERISKIDPTLGNDIKAKKVTKSLTKAGDAAKKQLLKEFNLQKIK